MLYNAEQLKRKETAWDGHHGIKQDKLQKTGGSGDAALKPYAPTGTKKKGEGKVKVLYKTHINVYLCIMQIATISDSSLTV